MSIELPIGLSPAQAHERATDDVNRWRGHCLESFARLERSMGEALDLAAAVSPSSKKAPVTFGDKVKALRSAVSSEGEWSNPRLAKALQEAGPLLEQRNRIVHASGKVWIDAVGNWAWSYRFKPAGKADDVGLYEQKAAHQFEVQLARVSQGLCSRLRVFGQKLSEAKP